MEHPLALGELRERRDRDICTELAGDQKQVMGKGMMCAADPGGRPLRAVQMRGKPAAPSAGECFQAESADSWGSDPLLSSLRGHMTSKVHALITLPLPT